MTLLDHFRAMLAYDRAAGAAVFDALACVEASPTPGSAETLARAQRILGHINSARHVWLARLGAATPRPFVMWPDVTVAQARAEAESLDQGWAAHLAALTDADLDAPVVYTSSEGVPYRSLRRDILTHVFNHSTYHRGQLAMLTTQCGGTAAASDYILFTRERKT